MLVFILSVAAILPTVVPESCYYQRCLGCHPRETVYPGRIVECTPENWVTPQWVHNYGHPPPSTGSKFNVEMSCLKMVASPDDKTFGNTVDVLKGCIPKVQVDSVCLGLVAVEKARGHSDARCFICNRNDCNTAVIKGLGCYLGQRTGIAIQQRTAASLLNTLPRIPFDLDL